MNGSFDRRPEIDVAKGIGIGLVIYGHIGGRGVDAIYVFHMPLFFLLAGMVRPAGRPLGAAAMTALAVTYLSFLLLVWFLPALIAAAISGPFAWAKFDHDCLKGVLGGRLLGGRASVFWFPSTLFLCLTALLAIERWLSTRAGLVAISLLAAAAYALALLWPHAWLPLDANVAPVALAFVVLGRALAGLDFFAFRTQAMVIAAGALAAVGAVNGVIAPMDMRDGVYGTPGLTALAAVACSLALLAMSAMLVRRAPQLARPLAAFGRMSLFVMYVHMPFVLILHAWSWPVRLAATVGICVLLYAVARRTELTRALFIGDRRAIEALADRIGFPRRIPIERPDADWNVIGGTTTD